MRDGTDLYLRSYEQVPQAWYETWVGQTPFFVVYLALMATIEIHNYDEYMSFLIVANALYVLGCLAERYSNKEVEAIAEELEQKYQVRIPLLEENIILGSGVGSETARWRVSELVDAALLLVVALTPQAGMALGVHKLIHGYANNQRVQKRIATVLNKIDQS